MIRSEAIRLMDELESALFAEKAAIERVNNARKAIVDNLAPPSLSLATTP